MKTSFAFATLGGLLLLGGCQKILGFEELEAGRGEAAGGDGSSLPSGHAGAKDDGPGELSGEACSATSQCASGLTCLFGFCRTDCQDDTACEQDSVCLRRDSVGGCRLPAETCDGAACASGELVCGLDKTCRIACSDNDSCEASTQRCVAGSCVSTVGKDTETFACGDIEDGNVGCREGALGACNVNAPGFAALDECGSSALCEASLPQTRKYDPKSAPRCASGCAAGKPYCSGATLLVCKDDGSGPVDAGTACATSQLCVASADANAKTCQKPACEANEVHCAGGQTELSVQKCSPGRDKLIAAEFCEKTTAQCNPAASSCVTLKVDPTEVTVAAYDAWLKTTPATNTQPAACSGNAFAPDATCMARVGDGAPTCVNCARPAVCVDWCDAYAYCSAKGQHLCGKIGGGMNPFDRAADAGSSEWMNACSAGGQYAWGSGGAPQMGAENCVYSGTGLDTSYLVGDRSNCASPSPGYKQLFDLSGNVEEWEDSCQKTAETGSVNDACRTRGGSFKATRDETRCDAVPATAVTRGAHQPWLGFRCCG